MDLATYAVEAAVEEHHWWFVGRRVLFSDIITGLGFPPDADILDVGTGTGANLRLLRDLGFTRVQGVDQSSEAIRFCTNKGLGTVWPGDICNLPFPEKSFDLIVATDVIEHVEDDFTALTELRRLLKPGKFLLLTVPTFPLLWGLQDEVSHHKRRYRLAQLLQKLHSAGLSPQQKFYFNYLLFVPILLARQLISVLNVKVASEGQINTVSLNRMLTLLFRLDVRTAPRLRPPVGVSALVLATRD
jgi:SAM-dependent methyltransferase